MALAVGQLRLMVGQSEIDDLDILDTALFARAQSLPFLEHNHNIFRLQIPMNNLQ
jgi:ABC-type lipopolysaccharide export system ATPase subunit